MGPAVGVILLQYTLQLCSPGDEGNDMKTQLLCLTSAINYDVRSFIRLPEGQLTSGETLKVVGFTFGRRPGPSEHIKALRRSYGARAWVLRHLKRIGMEEKLLVCVYCELIRPIFDYASRAFDTTMTDCQSESLEGLQRASLKTIFGFTVSYSDCLERAGIPTLKYRRRPSSRISQSRLTDLNTLRRENV